MFDLMGNVLEERLCTSLTKSYLYQLHCLGGNIYPLNVFFLKCTTATETLVKQCTTFLSLYLVPRDRPALIPTQPALITPHKRNQLFVPLTRPPLQFTNW